MLRSQTKLMDLGRRLCRSIGNNNGSNLTMVEVDDKTGIATLTLNKPPVNSCNLELLLDLNESIKQIERNGSRGLILTSSNDKVFSSGLDLNELHQPNQDRLIAFWRALQDMWLSLFLSRVPTAAAINGHAIAVGCVLATACEYRVMLPGFSIGIHATKFGYVVPPFILISYLSVLPRYIAERALLQGKLFSIDEALHVNLIDEVADGKSDAIIKCAKFIGSFAKTQPDARALTKRQTRAQDVQLLIKDPEGQLRESLEYINTPFFQQGLEVYLAKLKSKSKE
ncbi:enoyl-CoA delta isomerase 1, mitochondrial [Drosophila grimshawi]|uniref:Enoyl-CoA delta isomerase 1, mitochondrial n=1 Tax=Drosophila grimshawi TaxID=7222 RepID=B4JE41_DROGR|nr:enoyl-CoA delta isomerase 1, mitochondrial [Drosophila grimshawi]EDW03561.1 GH11303 [Drosophila grimshawi]